MKTQHLTLGLLALVAAGCGNSISAPASEAKGLVSLAYQYHASSPERAEHMKAVATKLTFEATEYKGKHQVDIEDSECGYGTCKKWEDKNTCLVKYKIGETWGILKNLTFDCEGNDADEQKKDALQQAKVQFSHLYTGSQIVMDEIEYTNKHLPKLAKRTLEFNAEVGDGYDAAKCINDVVQTMVAVNNEHSAWGCDTEWTGETLTAREGFTKKIAKMEEDIKNLDCASKDDDDDKEDCKNRKAAKDNQLKLLKEKETWVKSLTGPDARMYAQFNFKLGMSCYNKEINSNANYAENAQLGDAFEECVDYSRIGSGASHAKAATGAPASYKSKYGGSKGSAEKVKVTADDYDYDVDYKMPAKAAKKSYKDSYKSYKKASKKAAKKYKSNYKSKYNKYKYKYGK